MKPRHTLPRLAVIAGAVLASAPIATAEPPLPTRQRVVDLGQFSPVCKQFLSVPSDSKSDTFQWAQKLSSAACRQALVFTPVNDAEGLHAMVAGIEHALDPSLATYRDAIAHGPPEIQIMAAYGLGMTYVSVAVRARSSLIAPAVSESGDGLVSFAAYMRLHDALEPLLAQDLASARDAFRDVAALAEKYPDAAKADGVVRQAVADAHASLELLH